MKNKFKVGDIVRGTKESDKVYIITNSNMTKGEVVRVCDDRKIRIKIIEHKYDMFVGSTVEVAPRFFEKVKPETIVIYRKDQSVIALDKTTGKTAEARCNPADTFNFETDAKLAFERLFSSGDIVIGDKVHIIDTGALYCTNTRKVMEMTDNKKVLAQYAYGNNKGYPNKAVSGTYEVLNIDDEYVLIQKCIGVTPCSEVLLIGKRGLEKC